MCHIEEGVMQFATLFLSGRANFATEKDYEKLRMVIRCIIDSMNELLFLGATGMEILLNFIDTSYGVHNDFKSHAGASTSFG